MICYHSWVFVIVIVTGECTVLLLWIYGFKVCTLLLVLIILFESLYPFKLHYSTTTNNNTIFFVITNVTGELTMLVLPNYGSKVCVISFGFYSTQYKVYIHLPCNNIQQHTAEPFDITHLISSRYHQTSRLYQGSADFFKVDLNQI